MERKSFFKSLAALVIAPVAISGIVAKETTKPFFVEVDDLGNIDGLPYKEVLRIYSQTGHLIWQPKNEIIIPIKQLTNGK